MPEWYHASCRVSVALVCFLSSRAFSSVNCTCCLLKRCAVRPGRCSSWPLLETVVSSCLNAFSALEPASDVCFCCRATLDQSSAAGKSKRGLHHCDCDALILLPVRRSMASTADSWLLALFSSAASDFRIEELAATEEELCCWQTTLVTFRRPCKSEIAVYLPHTASCFGNDLLLSVAIFFLPSQQPRPPQSLK